MSRRFALAALIALPATFATLGAHAQTVTYCNGRIGAGFYGAPHGGGAGRPVSVRRYVMLHNLAPMPIRYAVTYTAPNITGAQNGSVVATLASGQTVTVMLGWQDVTFELGSPDPNHIRRIMPPPSPEIARYATVNCPA